jgi:hypothetical protein
VSDNVLPPTTPVALSGQLQSVVAESANLPCDFLVAGIPFNLHPTQDDPFVRDWQEDAKDQFDSSQEAGENSFGNWWLRSQGTFHGGQGQRYLDSSDPKIARTRFDSSRYAYPHRPGELTIAGKLTTLLDRTFGDIAQATWSGVQELALLSTSANQVAVYHLPNVNVGTIFIIGTTGIPAAITSDGVNFYVAIADAIWRLPPGGPLTKTHTLTFSGPVRLGFAKQRLIVTSGNKVYQLDPNPTAPPVAVTTPHYTNPSTGYVYTAVAEGPNGIYLAGNSGAMSDVSSMTVTDSGGTLVLGTPIVQLRFPPAEVVNDLFFYVGSFFAMATSKGVRVGSFTVYGQIQMGALNMVGVPAYALSGSGTLIYIGARDSVWWLDLSTPIDQSGTYAHAKYADACTAGPTDYIRDITIWTDPAGVRDHVYATAASGAQVSVEFAIYAPTIPATVTTSWSRFGTTEPKQLHYVRIEGTFPVVAGVQYVATVVAEADTGETVSFDIEGGQSSYEFSTAALPAAQAFRLTITLRDTGTGHGVTLRSYQLKALPTPRRFGEFILPLDCHDYETPNSGSEFGYDGFARERLVALEALARANARVTVVDKVTGGSYYAIIRRVQYRQISAPTATDQVGGLANVILRLV